MAYASVTQKRWVSQFKSQFYNKGKASKSRDIFSKMAGCHVGVWQIHKKDHSSKVETGKLWSVDSKSSKSWNTFLHLLHPKPPNFQTPLRAFLKEQTVQGTARSPVSILQRKVELRDLDVSLQMTGQPPATPWHGLLATAVMPPLWPLPEKWLGGRGPVIQVSDFSQMKAARFRALGSERSGRLFWGAWFRPDHGMDKCKSSHTPQTKKGPTIRWRCHAELVLTGHWNCNHLV